MYQNRGSITEVEKRLQQKKINDLIFFKKEFKCAVYSDETKLFEIEFYPKNNRLTVGAIIYSFAHYHNKIVCLKSIAGHLLKNTLKIENLVLCK